MWWKSIDFTDVLGSGVLVMGEFFKFNMSENWWFLTEFDRSFIFQWFDNILGVILVIFGWVKSGEMLDF